MKYLLSFFVSLFVFNVAYASPSVSVVSPNGGQCYTPGSTVAIVWSGAEYDHVALAYRTETEGAPPTYSSNPSVWNIMHPASGSSYNWATPSGIGTGIPYRIWIEAHSPSHGYLAVDSSDWSFGFATSCGSSGSGGTSGDAQAPTAPTASASAQSSSSISISWSGATDNVSVAGYTIYRNGTYLTTTTGLSYFDGGLSAGTMYSYTVAAYDAAGNMSSQSSPPVSAMTLTSSGSGSTTTTTDTSAPIISGVQAVNIMGSGAQITWTTDDPSDSRVMYGATSGNLAMSSDYRCDAGGNVTAHCVNLMSLAYNTPYYFKVESRNAASLTAQSAQQQFTSASSNSTTTTTTTTSGTSGTTSTTTQDTTAPMPPIAVSAYAVSSSSISISWSGATDNVSVAGYKIFRSGSHLSTTTGLSYTDTGLNASTNYGYAIAAYDAAGNLSGWSPSASATTMSAVTTSASNAVVSGKVADAKGVGLAGVFVNANQYAAGVFAQTKTGSDGRFALAVAPGEWGVSVYSEPMLGYYYQQGQRTVAVSSGQTVEVNFTMLVADAQIAGSVVGQNGQILTDAFGYVSTYASAMGDTGSAMMTTAMPAFGGSIEKGNFSFRVPAGTYALTIYFSPDSKYSVPSSMAVTVAVGAVQKVNFTIAGDDAMIVGSLRDASGAPVTGIDASKIKLYVSSYGGAWRNATVNAVMGTYSVQIGPGTWYLGAWVDSLSGYAAQGSDVAVTVIAGEKRTLDVTLTKADSFITGITKTADGSALANVWVSIENRSFADMSATTITSASASPFVAGGNSDNLGNFKIAIPPGAYFAHAHYPPEQGYINPAEVSVTVHAGETATVDLVFRKPDTKLTGTATIDGKGVSAFVWAWSESGGSASARSDQNGAYHLNVTRRDRWHVASSFEQNGAFYKSSDVVVEIADQASAAQDLVLLSVATLAQVTERAVEVAKPQSIEVSDGAKVTMPANALGTAGSANVTMKPTAEVPSFASSSVVGTGYQVDAKNEAGASITSLNSEITITIPYNDADLAAKGLTPESLALSFFDETMNVWKPLEKQIIDKQNKTISAGVNHLTLFALVAPADTAPPQAPTAVAASAAGNAIMLVWKNPSADFHHAKIYRSSQAGTLGEVVFNYVTNETKTDLTGTATHYYVVRSVDLAGNESANIAQVKLGAAVPATQATAALAAAPLGVLLVRVEGDPRVYAVKEGKRQWIRSPEEFVQGGYDWKAIVAISAAQLASYTDFAASSAVFSFTRNLSFGARSEAVRKLQELLAKNKEVYPQGIVSGYFGPATRAAVVRFQKKYGIVPASGLVGQKTRQKLNDLQSLVP